MRRQKSVVRLVRHRCCIGCGEHGFDGRKLGLGDLLRGKLQRKDVRSALKVPENFEVLVMLAVGYPGDKVDLSSKLLNLVRTRKSLSEVASEEEYGKRLVAKKIEEL